MSRNWLAPLRRTNRSENELDARFRQVDVNLAVGIERAQGRTCVLLTGELDLGNADALGSQLRHEEKAQPEVLEIDLRGLKFIDSSGLTELFAANRRARERNARIVLIKNNGPIERVLNIARVEDVIDVVEQPA
jgi:anti-anti-sigma factor